VTGTGGAAPPGESGLQAERTRLAWSRTALGVLANAALLAVREVGAARPSAAMIPAALAAVVALATILVGWQRSLALRRSPLPTRLAPTRAVPLIGWSVVALAIVSGVALFV
jgi:uncharacterized membrane protein YidH (DUF202 family)